MTFSPHGVIQSVFHFLPKLSSIYDMLPKNHMKYPLYQLYKFPVQAYVAIVSVLIKKFCLSQTHIARISFLILLEWKCHSSMNIWVVTFSLHLLQNIWITYNSQGTIHNLYLKTGISFFREGRMILTIINLTKIFTMGGGGGGGRSSIFFESIRSIYRQHSKKGIRGSQFWEP